MRTAMLNNASDITFCFGRMNPPTLGHALLFDTMAETACDYKIYVSPTQDNKKNPLMYEDKVKFIQLIHPEHAEHVVVDKSINTVLKVAVKLFDAGYKNAVYAAGEDQKKIYDMLVAYNGVAGKAHGFYNFDTLKFLSVGKRNTIAGNVSGISATCARQYVLDSNFEEFAKVTGSGVYATDLYNATKVILNETIQDYS
jgi:hypothetical protein